ncbi:helix-turn-helix domain-containing protein [uncultured Bilophila sp.]|uniref:helix-turn-helix domain-containing protein n=2 Tax=uncultured Bilophila sp. TaxID=529385 RepID=UPI0025CDE824|nr:helix-turn-helix domain-containing protein [uncultured Bilophila sp.]
MSRTLIMDIVRLTRDGWRPYSGRPEGYVYERLGCPYLLAQRGKPYWFVKGDLYLCVGCVRRCSLSRPEGFPAQLPIRYPEPRQPYTLTPYEMVEKKPLLTVEEAAYCLNVSKRTVYDYIDLGKLNVLKEGPKRVSSRDVRRMMEDFVFDE